MSGTLIPLLTVVLIIVFVVMQVRKRKAAAEAEGGPRKKTVPKGPGLLVEAADGLVRAKSGMGFRRIDVQDHTIGYLEGGSGDEMVMLLHGYGGEKDDWLEVASRLKKRYRVIAPDLPGSGSSSRLSTARYDVVTQARRLRAMSRQLNIQRWHLVGCYTGAAIAGIYASVFPEEVKTLTLIESFGAEPTNPSELDRLAANGSNPFADYERAERLLLGKRRRDSRSKDRIVRTGLAAAVWRDLTTQRPYLLQSVLSEVRVPTLLLWGDSNKVVHVAAQRVFELGLPAATSVVVKGSAHLMMLDRPQELLKHLEAFLAEVNAGGSGASPAVGAR